MQTRIVFSLRLWWFQRKFVSIRSKIFNQAKIHVLVFVGLTAAGGQKTQPCWTGHASFCVCVHATCMCDHINSTSRLRQQVWRFIECHSSKLEWDVTKTYMLDHQCLDNISAFSHASCYLCMLAEVDLAEWKMPLMCFIKVMGPVTWGCWIDFCHESGQLQENPLHSVLKKAKKSDKIWKKRPVPPFLWTSKLHDMALV